MVDAGRAVGEDDLAELKEDCRGRGVDPLLDDGERHRQDGSVAFGNRLEHGDLGLFELRERHDMELLDLGRVGFHPLARLGPADDGRHAKARARREVIEQTEHVLGLDAQSDFFVRLADRRVDRVFIAVGATARERPLVRMAPEASAAPRQQERSFAVLVGREDDRDAGRSQAGVRLFLSIETRESVLDLAAKAIIEGARYGRR